MIELTPRPREAQVSLLAIPPVGSSRWRTSITVPSNTDVISIARREPSVTSTEVSSKTAGAADALLIVTGVVVAGVLVLAPVRDGGGGGQE